MIRLSALALMTALSLAGQSKAGDATDSADNGRYAAKISVAERSHHANIDVYTLKVVDKKSGKTQSFELECTEISEPVIVKDRVFVITTDVPNGWGVWNELDAFDLLNGTQRKIDLENSHFCFLPDAGLLLVSEDENDPHDPHYEVGRAYSSSVSCYDLAKEALTPEAWDLSSDKLGQGAPMIFSDFVWDEKRSTHWFLAGWACKNYVKATHEKDGSIKSVQEQGMFCDQLEVLELAQKAAGHIGRRIPLKCQSLQRGRKVAQDKFAGFSGAHLSLSDAHSLSAEIYYDEGQKHLNLAVPLPK